MLLELTDDVLKEVVGVWNIKTDVTQVRHDPPHTLGVCGVRLEWVKLVEWGWSGVCGVEFFGEFCVDVGVVFMGV